VPARGCRVEGGDGWGRKRGIDVESGAFARVYRELGSRRDRFVGGDGYGWCGVSEASVDPLGEARAEAVFFTEEMDALEEGGFNVGMRRDRVRDTSARCETEPQVARVASLVAIVR
jgi:hypothetical protein